MKSFEKEIQDYIIKNGYFEEEVGEQITPEQYSELNNNDQEKAAIVKENFKTNVTEYYLKKTIELTPDQIKILSQIKTEKAVHTIKNIAVAFAVLTGINLLIVLIIFTQIVSLVK